MEGHSKYQTFLQFQIICILSVLIEHISAHIKWALDIPEFAKVDE